MNVDLTKDEMLLLCICVFKRILQNRHNGILDSSSETGRIAEVVWIKVCFLTFFSRRW